MKKSMLLVAAATLLYACGAKEPAVPEKTEPILGPLLTLGENSYSVGHEGGSFTVDVTHNVTVFVDLPEDVSWITLTETKSTSHYVFTVADNPTMDVREADIVFYNGLLMISEKVHVTQTGKTLQEMAIPGVYGLLGLEWEYVKGQHQLLYRQTEAGSEFVLMDPSENKLISFSLQGESSVGGELSGSILQNVNASMRGKLEDVHLKVDRVNARSIQVSAADDPEHFAILYRPS